MQRLTIKIMFLFLAVATPTSAVSAQGLATSVTRDGDTVSISVEGATVSSSVILAMDPMVCTGDVDGDRQTTAADLTAIEASYGPCNTVEKKIFDQNNDGFINSDDKDIVQSAIGCSDLQSFPVAGCSLSADINASTAFLVLVATDSSGQGFLSIPLGPGTDTSIYVQVIDELQCAKTPLASYRFLDEASQVDPVSSITCLINTDFNTEHVPGLVEIATDFDIIVTDKSDLGQTNVVLDASTGSPVMITLGETDCTFTKDQTSVPGVALGLVETIDLDDTTEYSEARLQHLYQPTALDVQIGTGNFRHPFATIWHLISPTSTSAYPAFTAKVSAFTTAIQISSVLDYYGVSPATIESAQGAIFIRVAESVDLDNGPVSESGFRIILKDFLDNEDAPFIAHRLLANDPNSEAPIVTVQDMSDTEILLQFTGHLAQGDHLVLLSEDPFSTQFAVHPPNPPVLELTPTMESGKDCPKDGTPPPPTNPPAVPGTPCTGGPGWIMAGSPCYLTGNYTSIGPNCGILGPVLIKSTSAAPGFKLTNKIKIAYKGSASVDIKIKEFLVIKVGASIEVDEENSYEYIVGQGNGCGENVAWYGYFKKCVTKWGVCSNDWGSEWYPWPVGFCTICYSWEDFVCEAGKTIAVTVCSPKCD